MRTSDLSILPPRPDARSIAPDFDIMQRTRSATAGHEKGKMEYEKSKRRQESVSKEEETPHLQAWLRDESE